MSGFCAKFESDRLVARRAENCKARAHTVFAGEANPGYGGNDRVQRRAREYYVLVGPGLHWTVH